MTTDDRPRPAKLDGSLAAALAAAAMSAPNVAGLALGASLVGFNDVVWSAVAGFAAGALLRRGRFWTSAVVAAAVIARLVVAAATFMHWPNDGFPAWWRLIVAATGVAAFFVGRRPGPPLVGVGAVALVAMLIVGAAIVPVKDHDVVLRRWCHIGLGGGAILGAALRARNLRVAAGVVLAAAACQYFVIRNLMLRTTDVSDLAAATTNLALAYVAGAFAAALDADAAPDAGARLVVMAQRRAWLTSALVAFIVTGLAGPWAWSWYPIENAFEVGSAMLLVPCGFAFLAHVGRGGRPQSDRLAPWLAANIAVLALAAGLVGARYWSMGWAAAFGLAMPLVVWPLVAAAILPGSPPGDETAFAAVVFTATLVLFPTVTDFMFGSPDLWIVPAALNLLLVPLAFHAVVRSRLASGWIIGGAAVLGLGWTILLPRPRIEVGHALPPPVHGGFVSPVTWLVAGLLVVAARRFRSMTAVPLDHPLVEDFGGA